ncbi:HNH endonuclease signature motif containing protein [Fictibacillus terranigra]|uniref:HNH endonuclease signature motif containing protein n=1 Tax=Fictibacillus terranigra TaxID=3058424 RepID=A0ABT8E6T8_9BACL|nr:HNH endonuclease signature motif containing protein [Fictibacillus sp. CENA-BCM004]MDN4073628.1 HNH endonuclease signature motif containing protein [Fictibacillus sp. CENA-BCM004]
MKTEKRCIKCEKVKSLKEFHKSSSCKDGRMGVCADCRKTQRKESGFQFKQRFYHIRNKMKTLGATDTLTFEQYSEVATAKECTYCGRHRKDSETFHIEHVLSPTLGYPNSRANIVASCGKCNYSKHNHDVLSFYERSKHFTEDLFQEFLKDFAARNGHTAEDMLDMLKHHQAGEKMVRERKAQRKAARKVGA